MAAFSRLRALWRNLLRSAASERELDEELRAFVDLAADDKEAHGLGREEARRTAAVELGGIEAVKEGVRDVLAGAGLEALGRDLLFAARQLCRNPGFAAAVVATLALAIGANAAVFSVVQAVLLAPAALPGGGPADVHLVQPRPRGLPSGAPLRPRAHRSPRAGQELRGHRLDLGHLRAGHGRGRAGAAPVGRVTSNVFSVLGAEPALGRNFEPGEEGKGAARAVILSDGLWRRRFGADPGIVGRTVRVDGATFTVVGVAPAGLRFLFPADSSVPAELQAFVPFFTDLPRDPRGVYYLRTIGRLAPGALPGEAAQEIAAIGRRLEAAHTEYAASGRSFFAVGLKDDAVREARPTLLTLLGAVGLVLLLACVNVANLLLGRELARREQMAVRAALGATRGRLVRQVLVETALLAGLGLLAGLALGHLLLEVLLALRPAALARFDKVALNAPVLAFTAGAGLLAALVVSFVGLGGALRLDLAGVLRGAGRSGDDAPRRRVRHLLVVSEVALGTVLLVGAGLLVRSFLELQRVDPGFRADRVLTFRLGLPGTRYPDREAVVAFARRLEERLRALPGVEAVGAMSTLPYVDPLHLRRRGRENAWRTRGGRALDQPRRVPDGGCPVRGGPCLRRIGRREGTPGRDRRRQARGKGLARQGSPRPAPPSRVPGRRGFRPDLDHGGGGGSAHPASQPVRGRARAGLRASPPVPAQSHGLGASGEW